MAAVLRLTVVALRGTRGRAEGSLLAGADTDPHIAAKFPEAFYELSQYQIGEAFPN